MDTLYEVHAAFKKCIPYYPNAAKTCQKIEKFILELQQTATSPQRFDAEWGGVNGGNDPIAYQRKLKKPDWLCGKSWKDRTW